MLRDVEIDSEGSASWASGCSGDAKANWQSVDQALRSIAKRQAALDAEEAEWLRKAEALQVWKRVGAVSMIDYLERVLGYAPRTSQDRLRVARALGTLPRLTAALGSGDLLYSAVRELSRVATPSTEAQWCDAALGKSSHQVQKLVADHRPGDRPDDPPTPDVHTHILRLELLPDIFALYRQVRTLLDNEHGRHLDDNEAMAALCSAVLDGGATAEPTGRARFQVAVTVCERCSQGWQDGGGARVAISADAVERALCNAQHIGSVDGHVAERAYQDIPPSIARLVWHRDGGRCRVPGCRSARNLELHHIVHRADGGTHDALNIALTCGACHRAHHAGLLSISGTADHLEVRRLGDASAAAPHRGQPLPLCQETGAHVGTSVDDGVVACPLRLQAAAPRAEVNIDEFGGVGGRCQETGAHVSASADDGGVACPPPSHDRPSTAAPREEVNIGGPGGTSGSALPRSQETGAHVGTNADHRLSAAVRREEVKSALLGLGWKPTIVRTALDEAMAALEVNATFDQLLREALRRCPKPSTTIHDR